MTGQSLLALPHFSVLSPLERSWQTASHAGARSSPCNMVALGCAAQLAMLMQHTLRHGPMLCRPSMRVTRDCGLRLRSNCRKCCLHPALSHRLASRCHEDDEPADLTRGCQRSASRAVDQASAASLTQRLNDPSRALLQSQSGPFAAKVPTALPTSPELRLEAVAFRVLQLRRLRFSCLWSPPFALAGVALIPLMGTTVHPAPALACCGPGPSRLKEQQPSPCLPRGGSNGQHQRPPA